MDDDALTVVRTYAVRGQADDLAERLRRSGILAIVVGPGVPEAGWSVAVPAKDSLRAGLIVAGLPRY